MNLFNTTVFRMAIRFAIVFVLIAVTALTSVYYFTFKQIEEQTSRELIHEIGELEAQFYQEGRKSLAELIERRDMYGKHLHHFYAFARPDLTLETGNEILLDKVLSTNTSISGLAFFNSDTTIYGEKANDILRIAVTNLTDGSLIVVGQEQHSLVELRRNTLMTVTTAVLITVLLSLINGFYMGKHVLKHIKEIDEGLAISINNDFNELLTVPKEHDEFAALTKKLNIMLAQTHDLIGSIRQVTDNVAHDLRSPLTRLRNRLEVTLLQSRSTEEYRATMEQAIEDCNEILKTFNALLSIARAEAGVKSNDWSRLDLALLLDEICELYFAVAEDKGMELVWAKPESVYMRGNRQLLAQAVSNILENAIKYTPENGRIKVELTEGQKTARLSVCDNGEGIPPEYREKVLARFQRLDTARSTPGSGLGLSLVQAVAKLHHAQLALDDNHPGLCVSLEFETEQKPAEK